jgi:PIN domain nuclease of toxin-antitoxin system
LILLDTHVVSWLAFEEQRVSATAKKAIQNSQGLAISAISLWELAMIGHRGRIRITLSLESFLREVEERFTVVPISASVCAQYMALPETYPKDPADRLIGATAMVEGIALVTADREIRHSRAIPTIW